MAEKKHIRRSRGRPPDWASDVELVTFVRRAGRRGKRVEDSCGAYRVQAGNRGPSVEALVRRYYRVSSAYPAITGKRRESRPSLFPGMTWTLKLESADSVFSWLPTRKPT